MNFIEIFRKYDKVVESFVRKTKSKSTRDIIDVADKYVTKDKEILRQLKEFIKQDGYEEESDFGIFKEDLPGCFYIEHQNNEGEFEEWVITELNLYITSLGEEGSYVEAFAIPEDYSNYVEIRWEELDVETRNQILDYLNFTDLRYDRINESFTKKISSKKNTDLISKPSFVPDNGVYILHETLGVRTVEGWNPEDNDSVVGILLIEDDHKIVIALEDSPENLCWSKKEKLVNRPIKNEKDAESDFNGEEYCRNLNSPDFPAAYYCLNYNKGGRSWYLPSMGELWLICKHLEEVQGALSIVGGQKFVTKWDGDIPCYWSSTEDSATYARALHFGGLAGRSNKVIGIREVRPISKFQPFELKESFTKKISSKKNTDLVPNIECPDGVYILHETLGVKSVEEWNKKFNKGVIGILLIEDDHKIVVALEDSPNNLRWSGEDKLANRPIGDLEDAESDFNGENYCRNLNSPDFPAAYYCLNYNKGGRDWYLPSAGELWMICRHLEEIQNALSIVGGKKFVTIVDDKKNPWYWSSTELGTKYAWYLYPHDGYLSCGRPKVFNSGKVRPISKFQPFELKESFTKKIKKQTSKNVIDNADEDIKMNSPLTFEDDEVSNIFFNEVVDVEDYEGGVYTLGDASVDSHVHDGYSEYFPFDDYQSNSWRDKNIVRFHELCFFTGLKKLPEYAFVNCTSLKEVTLPDNLEEIEQGAFANCTSLKTVKMPKNRTLRFINDSAFANTGLVSVVIPDGVEEIGDCAFADCHYLESVVIPPSVKEIRRGAFSGCPKLKSVSGIESVQNVGTDVFYGCGLEKEFSDSSVFSKFVTLRKFDEILFSGDWIDDSRKVKEMFLETYCMNHYDTDDYKHITDEEWEKDEFNPDSSNFDEERFYEYAWDYACDDVSWEWDDFKQSIEEKFQGRGGWICPEDEERFYNFSEAFSYCIPNDCNWQDLKVEQDGGYLIVCGTVIVPECDRYIDDEIGEIYPNEFIDYNSLRFCDPILDKETF